jgi:hypothetical protein
MLNALGFVLVVLTAAPPAGPITLERLGEVGVPEAGSIYIPWVGSRYVLLRTELEPGPKGRSYPSQIFVIGDVRERRLLRVPFRIAPKPSYELLYYRDDLALLHFWEHTSSPTGLQTGRKETFCFWNPQESSDCTLTEIGPSGSIKPPGLFYAIGADPTEQSYYFAAETRDSKPSSQAGPLSIKLMRISLSEPTLSIDWETELELPKRAFQLELSHRVFSPDGKQLALAEYHDLTDESRYSPSPPPQVYVIDLETKKTQAFPISFTPYGLTFSRDGKSLLVGSYQTGELIRINLQAGKIDARVKARRGIQGLFLSPKGGYFLVSYSSRSGSVPLEVRRWKDLKVAGTISLPPLLPELAAGAEFDRIKVTENGTRLVVALDGKRGGPRSDTRVIFDVKER